MKQTLTRYEQLIVDAIEALEPDAQGRKIFQYVKARRLVWSIGNFYGILYKMEDRGDIHHERIYRAGVGAVYRYHMGPKPTPFSEAS